MKRLLQVASASLVVTLSPAVLGAQEPASTDRGALLVFLDCQAPYCDFDHIRREVTWVNWVRDRQDSDVHVLVTAQITGGGGWDFSLDYIGLRGFEGTSDTLQFISDPDATDAEVRDGLANTVALGLVQYAVATSIGPLLSIRYQAGADDELAAQEVQEDDPWNLWVFRINANGSLEGEAQQSEYSVRGSASANRTSEDFKINFRVNGRYSEETIDVDDTTTVVDISENYSANVLLAWSLGEQWSAGATATGNRSTFNNRDLVVAVGPALEYNFFPYRESTRNSVTLRYTAELTYFNYELVTVEGKTQETLPRHGLELSAEVQQPWGRIFGSISGTQYLHSLATHRIDTFGFMEFRLFRGLNFNVNGSFSRIKDQFFLPAQGQTPAEILLERRQRETDFRYRVSMGFTYRFGSKFANVVNPRMGGGFFF